MSRFPKIAKLRTSDSFLARLQELGIELPFDLTLEQGTDATLAQPIHIGDMKIGNRFCILPMEGWDGTSLGQASDLTTRRWQRFGRSGAKLIWGGEAVAIRHDGRANPNQLLIDEQNLSSIAALRQALINEHEKYFGTSHDLSIGLQLTHSGRFARPNSNQQIEARTAYRHPILDEKFGVDSSNAILSDDELDRIIDCFVNAAMMAKKAGFDWVDIKHCHGYLGHELLSAHDRLGAFGGSFENRTRFLREVVAGIRAKCPGLGIGVRLSIFDFVPFAANPSSIGEPLENSNYRYAFGGDGTGTGVDLSETVRFIELLETLEIELLCTTAGSPYYCPHIQRPAIFPPSDGYLPPEDPLQGVARQISASAALKSRFPNMLIVGSGYSYLQEWLPHVAQAAVREGLIDSVGLGRMVLSYPEMPADVLAGNPLQRKKICRTFSDCTTAARHGLASGCYPLDPYYKDQADATQLVKIKKNT